MNQRTALFGYAMKPLLKLSIVSFLLLIICILTSCGGGGSGAPGATSTVANALGDTENYFPLNQGDTWVSSQTISGTGMANKTSLIMARVSGTKVINGVTATVITNSYSDTPNTTDCYLVKDGAGVWNYGDNTAGNSLYKHVAPYLAFKFPVSTEDTFTAIDKSGIDYGADLDGDGANETMNVSLVTKSSGLETVAVPAGTFANSARVEFDWVVTIKYSSNNTEHTITRKMVNWYAPGVGVVKSLIADFYEGQTQTTIDEITGCVVAGKVMGIAPISPLATGVAPANSDTESPGKPSIGFDGTNFLMIHRLVTGTSDSLVGKIISGDGKVLRSINISTPGSNRSSIAFDGNNYLVVYGRNGQIFGQRVSPSGTVLDGSSGFVIGTGSDNPAVAFDGEKYLVVWGKFNGQYDIYGAKVGTDGQVSAEFPISSAPGEQIEASIAFGGGIYLVVWRNTSSGSGPAATTDIYGARVSPEGTVLDPTGLQICTAPGVQGSPQVIFDGTNFFGIWIDGRRNPVNSGFFDINGARVTPAGILLDGPAENGSIAINTFSGPSFSGKYISVAFDGKDYLVAWSIGAFSNEPSSGVYLSRISKQTGLLINSSTDTLGIPVSGLPPGSSRFVYPVIFYGKGNSLLAWINNIELSGVLKTINAALVLPFAGAY
jgi:hypothetical protein